MTPNREKILPEVFSDMIEHRKGPARVEINTGYRTAYFDAIPEGDTLKIVCQIDIPGDLPDAEQVRGFITTMVHAMIDMAVNGKYDRMQFDVPAFGERMSFSLIEDGQPMITKEIIGGGVSTN